MQFNDKLTLSNVCSNINYGYTASADKVRIEGTKLLRITDIQNGSINWSTVPVCDITESDYKKYQLKKGDIVVARTGNTTGENAQIKSHPPKSVFASYLIRFEIDQTKANPFYIGYQLRSSMFTEYVNAIKGGSAQPGANAKQLGAFPIYLIDRALQNKAVSVLTNLDKKIDLLKETNKTLESIAQAIFKSWFVDFDPVHAKAQGLRCAGIDDATAELFPDSFEDSELGKIPKGWKFGVLGDLAGYQNGYAFKSSDWKTDGHPVIKIANVKRGLVNIKGCSFVSSSSVQSMDRFIVKEGDFLVGMTGENIGERGLMCHTDKKSYLNQRVCKIITKDDYAGVAFTYIALMKKSFKDFIDNQSQGSAQANISGNEILKYPLTLPPQNIIKTFNSKNDVLIQKILSNYRLIYILEGIRDTLLPRLISGKLDLSEIEEQLEGVV